MNNYIGSTEAHTWIRKNYGNPTSCEKCGSKENLEWSRKNHQNLLDRKEWQPL